jgi:hypothetical protein
MCYKSNTGELLDTREKHEKYLETLKPLLQEEILNRLN